MLLRRFDSAPGGAVHVCSFTPVLRFNGSDLRGSTRFRWILPGIPAGGRPLPVAVDDSNPSAKKQDTEIMLAKKMPNFSLTTNPSELKLGSTCPPPDNECIFNNGPFTAEGDWSGQE